MNVPHETAHHAGAVHDEATLKGYMIGFALSVVLTAIPFWLVMSGAIASKPRTGIATKASKPAISIRSNWTLCCSPSCAPQAT